MGKPAPAWGCQRILVVVGSSFLCGALFGSTYLCPQLELISQLRADPDLGVQAPAQLVAGGSVGGVAVLASPAIPAVPARDLGGASVASSPVVVEQPRPAKTKAEIDAKLHELRQFVRDQPRPAVPAIIPAQDSSARQNGPAPLGFFDNSDGDAIPPGKTGIKVAFAVFVTDITTPAWQDALEVLAFGLKRAKRKSRHIVENIVIAPDRLTQENGDALLKAGFDRIVRKPIPVMPEEVKKRFAQEHLERVQGKNGPFKFLMAEETVKYWGVALTEYDRVLVLDADVMIIEPMDELFELDADFIGIYDHGLDTPTSSLPPAQGGFLLFRPNKADFDAINDLTREGDWDGGGWKRSGIGFCYGGVGPDGLLQYYYNKDALATFKRIGKTRLPEGPNPRKLEGSRWIAVDREVYDVVINKRLRDELDPKDHAKSIAAVQSVHFTGDCVKPWSCSTSGAWFCKGLMEKWWEMRAELEAERGLPRSYKGCRNGKYTPLEKHPQL